jgi:hypothetical protein
MSKFAPVASTALCLSAIWSTSAPAIVPAASRAISPTAPALESAALICHERCGYYGCPQICVHRPGCTGDTLRNGWYGTPESAGEVVGGMAMSMNIGVATNAHANTSMRTSSKLLSRYHGHAASNRRTLTC